MPTVLIDIDKDLETMHTITRCEAVEFTSITDTTVYQSKHFLEGNHILLSIGDTCDVLNNM